MFLLTDHLHHLRIPVHRKADTRCIFSAEWKEICLLSARFELIDKDSIIVEDPAEYIHCFHTYRFRCALRHLPHRAVKSAVAFLFTEDLLTQFSLSLTLAR